MYPRIIGITCGLLVCFGVAHAAEFSATLVKMVDGKLTLMNGVGKKKKEFTIAVDEKCVIVAAKYDKKTKKIEAGDAIVGGLKNPLFDKLDKEPVEAWVRTSAENDKVLELRLYQSTKAKKPKN